MWDSEKGLSMSKNQQAPPNPEKKPPLSPSPPPPDAGPPPPKGVKGTLVEFAESTTAHGIGRVASSTQLWLKAFWALIFLAALSIFIWQSVDLFLRYLENSVTVDVKVVYEEVDFPAVSVCNLNALRKNQLYLGGKDLSDQIQEISVQLESQLSGSSNEAVTARRKRRALTREAEKRGLSPAELLMLIEDDGLRERVRREAGVDACSPSPCQNGGTCVLDAAGTSFSCNCPSGYEGSACQTDATTPGAEETTTGLYDPSDEYYSPTTDLSEKPWFSNNEQPDIRVQTAKNMSRVLRGVPIAYRQKMGHRVDDMIQECSWDGKQCTPLNFTGFLNKYYGNCYTFNSGFNMDKMTSTKPGSLYGFSATIFIEQEEYIDALSPSAGIRVLIHTQSQQPFPEDDGFDVTPGHKTSITLRMRKSSKQPWPYSNCTKGDTEELMYKKDYSVGACRRSCLQLLKHKNCTCADAELPVPDGWKVCETNDEITCSEAMDTAVETGKHPCKCPELCDEDVYITSIATSEWPGEAFEATIVEQFSQRDEKLAQLLKAGKIRENFLKLEVFFEEIRYDMMTEQPAYGVVNLLADIGGQLGLWIGVSMLTIVEVIQLIITLIQVVLSRNRIRQQQAQDQAKLKESGHYGNGSNGYPPNGDPYNPPPKHY